jgi:hypothetical protein
VPTPRLRDASYVGVYPAGRDRRTVRAELVVRQDDFVFLSLGNLRAYKQLDVLLAAFRATSSPAIALVVAGEVSDPQEGDRLLAAARDDPRVRPLPGRVPDDRALRRERRGRSTPRRRRHVGSADPRALHGPARDCRAGARRRRLAVRGGQCRLAPERAREEAAAGDPVTRAAIGAAALDVARRRSWDEVAERTAQLLSATTPRRRQRRGCPPPPAP